MLIDPIELPIIGAVGAGIVIYSFSRVMLGLPSKSATVVTFAIVGALVLGRRCRGRDPARHVAGGAHRHVRARRRGAHRRWRRLRTDGRARDPPAPHPRRHRRGERVRAGGDRGRRARQPERGRQVERRRRGGVRRHRAAPTTCPATTASRPVSRCRARHPATSCSATTATTTSGWRSRCIRGSTTTTCRSVPSGSAHRSVEPGSVQFLTLNFAHAQLGRRRWLRVHRARHRRHARGGRAVSAPTDSIQKVRTATMTERSPGVRHCMRLVAGVAAAHRPHGVRSGRAPGHVEAGRRRTPRRSRTCSGGCS